MDAVFIPALHLENEPELCARLLQLAQAARQEGEPVAGIAPYKGLLCFEEADAALFFGREELTARLVERVSALALDSSLRFLAVVGASGSGKSSLVRAGLAVALKQQGWATSIFTPTADPLIHLEAQHNTLSATDAVPILILVDQFEETFTLCHDEATRRAFIDKLLALATPTNPQPSPDWGGRRDLVETVTVPPPTWLGGGAVVITLRADFYAHCAQHEQLRHALAAQQEYIGQMTTAELRRAIEEPAKQGGWVFEPGLVDRLLHDIGAHDGSVPEPGALPLLSHALLATWERRRGRTFTLAGYQAAGGVRRAIAETAESVFTDQLDGTQQELARHLFLRLTELGEGTEDTRRRTTLTELVHQSTEAAQLRMVLNTLAEARLVTLNADSAEVAHEALIREWQRLHGWLTQDREGLRLHRHLTAATREWESLARDAGALYRGARLAQVQEWAVVNAQRLNEAERAFLAAAVAQEEHEGLVREAQRQRELAAAQTLAAEQAQRAAEQSRAAQQLRRRAYGLSGAFVLVAILAGVAFFLGRQATAAQQMAFAREVAASALNNLTIDPERSILLALQAVQISQTGGKPVLVEAADALHRAVQSSHLLATLREHTGEVWALAVNPDGTRLATVSLDGTIKLWDLATNRLLLTLSTQLPSEPTGIGAAFTPDGKYLFTSSADNSAKLWDLATGQAHFILTGHTALVTSVAISPDGKLLVTASDDTTVKLWDAQTGKERETLTAQSSASPESSPVFAQNLRFSGDGNLLFVGTSGGDNNVIAWDVATGQERFHFSGGDGVLAVAASPDGTQLATAEFDTTVKLWDANGKPLRTLFGHASLATSVAYSPDGKTVASASEDGVAKLWDPVTGRELLTLAGHTSGVLSLAFSPTGERLYTASRDGTVRSWDIAPTAGREWLNLPGHQNRIGSVAYRPDGAQLVTGGWDHTVKVWDATSGKIIFNLPDQAGISAPAVAYSPDSHRLAIGSGNQVAIVDANNGTLLRTLAPFADEVTTVVFAADNRQLAAADRSGLVSIYDSHTGDHLRTFTASTMDIQQLAFSPEGKRLAVANSDRATVWEISAGQQLLSFSGHGAGVRTSGIAFSPDGQWLATTGNDATVQVWDATTGAVRFRLTGHTGPTFGVAFSPDGQLLATSSVDRTVKIWQLPGQGEAIGEPLTLYGNSGAVYQVAFSPEGSRLAAVGRDLIVRVYALRIEDLITIAEARVTRALTVGECQKFLHVDECPR